MNTTAFVADPGASIALGLAVFPAAGRRPAFTDWATSSTRDTDTVGTWPASWNPGIGCRANNLVVLDIDQRLQLDGATVLEELCETAGDRLPTTLTVRTPSGGRHLYFHAPAGRWTASGQLAPGIDVRGPGRRSGGYVLGPGSIVAGGRYDVEALAPVAALPAWLTDTLPGRPWSRA